MSDLYIAAVLYAKQRQENQLRTDLTALVDPSRRDEGNLRYELFADQSDPRRFVIVEHWANPASREKHHTQSEHILNFHAHGIAAVENLQRLPAGPDRMIAVGSRESFRHIPGALSVRGRPLKPEPL